MSDCNKRRCSFFMNSGISNLSEWRNTRYLGMLQSLYYEINTTWRRWVRKFGKLFINPPTALKLSQTTLKHYQKTPKAISSENTPKNIENQTKTMQIIPKLHQNTSKMFPGHPRTETKQFKLFDFFGPRTASTTSKSTSRNDPVRQFLQNIHRKIHWK